MSRHPKKERQSAIPSEGRLGEESEFSIGFQLVQG